MDIHTAFRMMKLIGLPKALQLIHYTLYRDRLERQHVRRRATGEPRPPGQILETTPLRGGARFRFAEATLEIRFLAPDLAHISWQPGKYPISYAIARSAWPEAAVSVYQAESTWILRSSDLEIAVRPDGSLSFCDPAGRTLRQQHPPTRRGEAWTDRAPLRPEEHLFGLGERAASLNLRGRSFRMWNSDPAGGYRPGTDPLYLCTPVYLGVHAEGSYLLFYENPYPATFSFTDQAEAQWEGGALSYYLIPGPPTRALERYSELTGRPPLPPRWALGYHQSRWGYRDEAEIRQVAAGFLARDLPLSAIHLDIDHMDGYRVFTIHPERFPDLAALAADLAAQGIHLVAIVDPGVKCDPDYDLFCQGLERNVFCTLPDGRLAWGIVWPGRCAFPDFTDPLARAWWGQHYTRLLEAGIAGFWHDMNEPSVQAAWGHMTLPLHTRHAMGGRGGDHHEAHNLYGLLMNRAGHEALRQHRPERRPFIVSRSGWAGMQRYAWNWTGDTDSTWESLRQTIPTVLGLGLSGVPYTGPDVGGFSGAPSAELYLRWFQMSAFLPFFRTHSAWTTPRREPWTFGEPTLAVVREFLRLRYRLLPYLYTLAWESSRTGHPLVRPLFWPRAEDPALWDVEDAFLLGDAILVAPILEKGALARSIDLPGTRWYDLWDDTPHDGPGTIRVEAPLQRIPVLVRAGTVLPMEEGGRLTLHLYPPAERVGDATLYSDAGDGYGDWRLDHFRLQQSGKELELTWDQEGQFPFPWTEIEIRLHGIGARRAWVNGNEVTCTEKQVETGPFRRTLILCA